MSRIQFSTATASDDEALRDLLRRNVLQGDIAVSFRREPSYFYAAEIQGREAQIFKGLDIDNNRLAGIGGRFILPAYINGDLLDIGYLADLRVEATYRNGLALRRGFDVLQLMHDKQPLPIYTTMILKNNHQALKTIAANRAGMPTYKAQGFVHTPMIALGWPKNKLSLANVEISTARPDEMKALFCFINQQHARRQFAPHYDAQDLQSPRLRALKPQHFLIARKDGKIIGTLAAWDLHTFRQIHVEGYHSYWRWFKPIYNAMSYFSPFATLPKQGESLRCLYVALLAIKEDDKEVFRLLLRTLYNRYCGLGWHYFTCALHERDPLLPVLQEYKRIDAGGHLFTVNFNNTDAIMLDDKIPYVEAAAL